MATTTLGSIFRALAEEQAGEAVRSLAQRRNRHDAIHAARKAIRRLRSILSLCHQALEPEASAVDRALKRIANSLSDLRDANVVVETATQFAEGPDGDAWLRVATLLKARRDAMLAKALASDPAFTGRVAQMNQVTASLAALPWQRLSRARIEAGMARSSRRVAKAKCAFELKPNLAGGHRWRRLLRRLRMQAQVIRMASRIAPSLVGSARNYSCLSVKALNRRSDRLGRAQDLRMLRSSLKLLERDLPLPQLRRRLGAEIKATLG